MSTTYYQSLVNISINPKKKRYYVPNKLIYRKYFKLNKCTTNHVLKSDSGIFYMAYNGCTVHRYSECLQMRFNFVIAILSSHTNAIMAHSLIFCRNLFIFSSHKKLNFDTTKLILILTEIGIRI